MLFHIKFCKPTALPHAHMPARGQSRRRSYPRIEQQTSANTTGACLFQTDQDYTQFPLDGIRHCGIGKSTYAPKENASALSTLACVIFEDSPGRSKLRHRALLLTVAWLRGAEVKAGVQKLDILITQVCDCSSNGIQHTRTAKPSPACQAFDAPFRRHGQSQTPFSSKDCTKNPCAPASFSCSQQKWDYAPPKSPSFINRMSHTPTMDGYCASTAKAGKRGYYRCQPILQQIYIVSSNPTIPSHRGCCQAESTDTYQPDTSAKSERVLCRQSGLYIRFATDLRPLRTRPAKTFSPSGKPSGTPVSRPPPDTPRITQQACAQSSPQHK